jgi:hypothetical protein
MAKKVNEQKPEVQNSKQASTVINVDGVDHNPDNFTEYQKDIYNDIYNYQVQQNRLERWKQGQFHILGMSLKEKVENGESKPDQI